MSFRSGLVQKKLKDDQFIGDLISLFERRKIKTGDPASLDSFDSLLSSNDAFRSQLFTLCTAISHMSAEDLSGEQLLALVARALGGLEVCKADGTVDVPDAMRSAFLSGYDAWTNRTFEPKEPLPWPTPRQPESGEALSASESTETEPAARKTLAPGIHTMQDAIALARERSLADAAAHPSSQSDTKIEGLTLSELKALLAEIENRVSRIQPHLNDLNSISRPPAEDFGPRDRMRGIDPTHTDKHAAQSPSEIPLAPRIDAPAAALALDTTPTPTPHRATRPSSLNEAAFLARHAYLRPTRGAGLAAQTGGSSPTPAAAAIPVTSPAAPVLAVAPSPNRILPDPVRPVEPPVDLSQFSRVAPIPATPVAAIPVTPVVESPPQAPVATLAPNSVANPTGLAIVPRANPIPYIPDDEPASLAVGRIRISRHMAIGGFTVLAALIVVVSGLAGIFIYPSLHPKTINDYPDLKPQAMDTSAPDASTPAQVIVAAPADAAAPAPHPSSAINSSAKAHFKAPPAPTVNVWPATNLAAPRAAAPTSVPALPVTTQPARRNPAQAAPLYVPSATLISSAVSATQPSYPRDQPRGINGTVVVQITISRDGYVTDIRVVSGPVEMRQATIQAVQSWRFRPYLVDGTPTEVTTTLGFLFKGQ